MNGVLEVALALVAGILAVVEIIRTSGQSLLGWAVLALALVHVLGRLL